MDSAQIQNTLKALCKVMWDNNVTNPITYVTQISYLLFLKMIEEMDHEQKEAGNGNHRSLFGRYESEGEELDFDSLRWSVLASDPDNERMLRTLRDTLPLLARHPKLSLGARAVFRNAAVVIPSGAALRRAVDIIAPISFLGIDADVKGDLFEYLASELGGQKKAAQFRTPRHLIRVIVQMVDPRIGQTICDPACGSDGFPIAAYEHILLANTGPEFIREKIGPDGLPRRIGIGDRLSRAQWDFLQKGTFHSFDGDQDILRMAAMNAVLHGFDESPIVQRDSICGSEDKWDEIQFDCILENPPFSGSRGDAKRSLRIEKGDKYVLFLAHALRSLRQGGTAGIIFPNGILFGNTGSHLTVKERLLKEFDLQALVVLPKGMFEPYTPNPTCFMIFRNTGRPTQNVWFFKVDGDGSSLSRARKFGPQYRNDFLDLLRMWPGRETEEGRAWLVPAQKIIDNGFKMTLTDLGLIETETVEHLEPEEILSSVVAKEESIMQLVQEMRDCLEGMSDGGYTQDWLSEPFAEAVNRFQTRGRKLKTAEYQDSGILPIVDQGQTIIVGYTDNIGCKFQGPYPVVVFGDHTKNVKFIDFEFAVGADGVVLLRPRNESKLDIRYLYYWLKFIPLHNLGYSRHFKLLKEEEIAFPANLGEQRRIVERIEKLIFRADEVRHLRIQTEEQIDKQFKAALLAKAFRGEL